MQTVILYRYSRPDGGITTSPVKPNGDYTEMYRLVADEGKALTNDGVNFTSCIDVASADGWYEVTASEDGSFSSDATEADYLAALERFGVTDD